MSIGGFFAVFAAFIIYGLVFGKTKEFEFEAKLIPEGENEIVGEIEIEKYKKEDPFGELSIYSINDSALGIVEVYHEEKLISRFEVMAEKKGIRLLFPTPSPSNGKKTKLAVTKQGRGFRFPVSQPIELKNNHKVRVCISGQPQLFGVFLKD